MLGMTVLAVLTEGKVRADGGFLHYLQITGEGELGGGCYEAPGRWVMRFPFGSGVPHLVNRKQAEDSPRSRSYFLRLTDSTTLTL